MSNQKNVMLINTDHWFAGLLGEAGHETVMTPTLDQLARDGIRFENMYSECPVCIPARRTLMTGLYAKSHGDRIYNDTLHMPDVVTLAESFVNAGYQAYAVGKLHVLPQRNRIGFNDVILQEEGRYEFGVTDDYQTWLGDNGYIGEEFSHGMGNNTYYTRPWHLDERAHPTTWATKQMMRTIKRKDPTKPAFYYLSYQFPHPPLVPLKDYLDMYHNDEIDIPISSEWSQAESYIMKALTSSAKAYSDKEIRAAKKAFYAQCTHIDHQIRLIIGTLRECNLLDDTIIAFTSDHGDMLFDHHIVGKRVLYEGSANIPLIISGKPVEVYRGTVDKRLGTLADLMPTLLDLCGIDIPQTVEGESLFSQSKMEMIYGEVSEGSKATRMVRDQRFKLIYYPMGNIIQLFDLDNDKHEQRDLANNQKYDQVKSKLVDYLIQNLYNEDKKWVKDSKLIGIDEIPFKEDGDYGLFNQRGLHWPTPSIE